VGSFCTEERAWLVAEGSCMERVGLGEI
jgi:hypothetical protein